MGFGDFVLDRGRRQLLRADEVRHLGPKAFELLDVLLSHRPNVVAKERIRDRLWPGTHVSDSTLATVVAEVRTALDEDPKEPRFLRTVHGVGYAFCGQATDSGPQRVTAGSPDKLPAHPRRSRGGPAAGREPAGKVDDGVAWIEAPTVSRRHARILVEEDRAILEDLGSKNGTFVRGERISEPTVLAHGDVIRLGRVSMKLQAVRADQSTLTGSE